MKNSKFLLLVYILFSFIGTQNIKAGTDIKKEYISFGARLLPLLTGLYLNSKVHYGKDAWETEAYNDGIGKSILTGLGATIFIENLLNPNRSKTEILIFLSSILAMVYGYKKLNDVKAPRCEHREGKKYGMINGGLIGVGIGLIINYFKNIQKN